MIVAKLSISYDRGTSYNQKSDVGATLKRGDTTANGGVVRGLGSHFRSQADMVASQTRDKEAHRIYSAFREQFMTTTIDGLYIVPHYGAAKAFVASLNPVGIDVRVAEFELTSAPGLDAAELTAWGAKVKRQMASVALGRKKGQVDLDGLRSLKALTDCPLLTPKSREEVRNLISMLESTTITKSDFRKRLDSLNVQVEQIDRAHAKVVADVDAKASWADDYVPPAKEVEASGS